MMPFDSGRRYVEATRGGCRSEVPASSDVIQVHLNASSDRVAQVQSRLLRRHAPRNDACLRCHCERSEAISQKDVST